MSDSLVLYSTLNEFLDNSNEAERRTEQDFKELDKKHNELIKNTTLIENLEEINNVYASDFKIDMLKKDEIEQLVNEHGTGYENEVGFDEFSEIYYNLIYKIV